MRDCSFNLSVDFQHCLVDLAVQRQTWHTNTLFTYTDAIDKARNILERHKTVTHPQLLASGLLLVQNHVVFDIGNDFFPITHGSIPSVTTG